MLEFPLKLRYCTQFKYFPMQAKIMWNIICLIFSIFFLVDIVSFAVAVNLFITN